MQICPRGVFRQIGEIYVKIFIAIYILFSSTHLQVRLLSGFLRAMAQTMRYQTRMCLFGAKKLKIKI